MAATARPSFSNDSRIVSRSLPKSVLLKDHLLDDLSSCSSNGFRSYPRTQCCTKVRYLIEIDLSKHKKLPQTQKQLLKSRSKPKLKSKSSSLLHKASAAVVNVLKNFRFSGSGYHTGSGKTRKTKLLPRNLSRKLSMHGFLKRTVDHRNSFEELYKQNENTKRSAAVTTTKMVEVKTTASNMSNSSVSGDSYSFSITSDCSTIGGSSKINDEAQNVVKECDKLAIEKMIMVNGENAAGANSTGGNAKENHVLSEKKDHFSPISVMDFPCDNDNDDEDEVTSTFHDSYLYIEGSKRKVKPKVQMTNNLKPIRLEYKLALSESTTTHDLIHEKSLQSQLKLEENQAKKKAVALLHLFKATMPSHGITESVMTENVLLEFFAERLIEGNVSNYTILQDAKDWINGITRKMFDSDDYKQAHTRDMEKGSKWLTYDGEAEKEEIVLGLEYVLFTSLVQEMLLDLYL